MSKGGSSIPDHFDIKIGSDGTTAHIDTDLDNIRINNIAPITSNIAVTQPIVSNSTSKSDSTASLDLKVEPLDIKIEPLETTSVIDLKPVAVDTCTTIKLAPLPPIRMEQPYSQHLGFTFMGMELFGLTVSSKSELFLHSPPKEYCYPPEEPRRAAPDAAANPTTPRSGLRVRLSDQK